MCDFKLISEPCYESTSLVHMEGFDAAFGGTSFEGKRHLVYLKLK